MRYLSRSALIGYVALVGAVAAAFLIQQPAVGGPPQGQILYAHTCQENVACNDRSLQCFSVATGSTCYYCSGSGTDDLCVPAEEWEDCVHFGNLKKCGLQIQGSCNAWGICVANLPTQVGCSLYKCD